MDTERPVLPDTALFVTFELVTDLSSVVGVCRQWRDIAFAVLRTRNKRYCAFLEHVLTTWYTCALVGDTATWMLLHKRGVVPVALPASVSVFRIDSYYNGKSARVNLLSTMVFPGWEQHTITVFQPHHGIRYRDGRLIIEQEEVFGKFIVRSYRSDKGECFVYLRYADVCNRTADSKTTYPMLATHAACLKAERGVPACTVYL